MSKYNHKNTKTKTGRKAEYNKKFINKDYRIVMQDLLNSYHCTNDTALQKFIEKDLDDLLSQLYNHMEKQNTIKIWVDGSYNAKTKSAGIGIVIITDDHHEIDQKVNIAFGKSVNAKSSVLAEIYALSIGLSYVLDTFEDNPNIHIYYDCKNSTVCATNIEAFTVFGAPYTNFKSALKRIKRRKINVVFEHTKAHSSDYYNNICDLLAKHYSKAKLQNQQKKLINKYITKKGANH
jgi:ribonuclease HI